MTDDQTPDDPTPDDPTVGNDEPLGTGLGWVESPQDPRDFPIDELYAARGVTPPLSVPASYLIPGSLPPVLNQHDTPQCVAFSSEFTKSYEDRIDQGQFFPFNEPEFFRRIGGGPNGAVIRVAFDQLLKVGYPVDVVDNASLHKIRAYYRVSPTKEALQAAIVSFGPVVIGMTWYNSWFQPGSNGVLPAPADGVAGGHAIAAIGWDSRGLRLRQSWGPRFGINGDCWLPWDYLSHVGEGWKAVDVIETPPKPSPVDPVKYVHVVRTTGTPYTNIRKSYTSASSDLGNLAPKTLVHTTLLKKRGGKYKVGARTRTDWLGFVYHGRTCWIAAGYTALVK